jgi:hypothetical protein
MRGRSQGIYWLLPTNSTRIVGFRGDDIRVDDVSHACRAVSDQRPHCDRRTCERRSRSRQMGGPGADLAGAPTITGRAAVTAHLNHPHRTRVPGPEGAAMLDHTSKITPAKLADFMPTVEAQFRQILRDYAVELRQLAYTLPNGVGEHDFLQRRTTSLRLVFPG